MSVSAIYESTRLLDEYLLFHYALPEEMFAGGQLSLVPNYAAAMREGFGFPQRTVSRFSNHMVQRGLDLGCAVGRSSFEMAKSCREVVGIDFSRSFIRHAQALQRGEEIRYTRLDEGHSVTELVARVPQDCVRESVSFEQGDAMDLRADLGDFDRVHAANVLCRLTHPLALLQRLPHLVRPGGELVLATPCSWLQEFTFPQDWPQPDTFTWLQQQLQGDFILLSAAHEPFLIRETARKFQWSFSLVSVWRRRADANMILSSMSAVV